MEQISCCDRNSLLNFYQDRVLASFSAYTGDVDRGRIHEQLAESYILQNTCGDERKVGTDYTLQWDAALHIQELHEYIEFCISILYDIGGSFDAAEYPDAEQ
jgi:hypothetical protein